MLSPKTTIAALIAALSVIATASAVPALIPQAFAFIPDDDDGNTVTADQSNSFTANVDQSISQSAGTDDDDDDGTSTITQEASQGFCLQVNQQNAAAGDDATNTAANAIAANDESAVDCS
jgi:hypothetical protein